MFKNGYWSKTQFEENADMVCSIPIFKAFSPKELEEELKVNGMKVKQSRSIGTLSHLLLLHLRNNEFRISEMKNEVLNQFIDLCEQYDEEIMPDGPGSFRRSGIIAVAETGGRQGFIA